MSALARLLQKSRPYVAFSYELEEGQTMTLHARRMGQVDIETAAYEWEQAYRKAKDDFQDEDKERTAIYDALNRAKDDRLASIIASAERPDYLSEIANYMDKSTSDEEVQKEAEARVEERKQELLSLSHKELVEQSFARRYHSFAMDAASLAQMRSMLRGIIFEEPKPGVFEQVFKTPEDVAQLPHSEIIKLMGAASNALDPNAGKEEAEAADPLP